MCCRNSMEEWLSYTQLAAGSSPADSTLTCRKVSSRETFLFPLCCILILQKYTPGSDHDEEGYLLFYRTPEYPESG